MNIKRTVGILLLVIGLLTVFYANYQKARISSAGDKAYGQINQGSSFFSGNPVGGVIAGSAKKKVTSEMAKYYQIVQCLLIGGIVVAVIGGGMAIFCSKKTRKKR